MDGRAERYSARSEAFNFPIRFMVGMKYSEIGSIGHALGIAMSDNGEILVDLRFLSQRSPLLMARCILKSSRIRCGIAEARTAHSMPKSTA